MYLWYIWETLSQKFHPHSILTKHGRISHIFCVKLDYVYVEQIVCTYVYFSLHSMYITGIKPKEGLHLPDGVPVDSVLISSPYPSFHDESIEPLQELSYVADTQIAEAAKLEELPMVSNKRSQFPLGTYDHILGPLLQGWAWVLVRRKKRVDFEKHLFSQT